VKVLDFGLAKVIAPQGADSEALTESKVTGTGHVLGTVAYMSPEQARGQKVDARSDIFSFGIVFYEMLAGQGPFRGQSAAEVLSAILRDKPLPLRTARPDLPEGIERIVDKALEKDLDNRYQDMPEVLADLERLERDAGPAVVPGAVIR
jgi:serine/threonine protein kinase